VVSTSASSVVFVFAAASQGRAVGLNRNGGPATGRAAVRSQKLRTGEEATRRAASCGHHLGPVASSISASIAQR
jgi:hypothetical protein